MHTENSKEGIVIDPEDEAKKEKNPFYKLESTKDSKMFQMVTAHQLKDLMEIKNDFEKDYEANQKIKTYLAKRSGIRSTNLKVPN